MIHRLLTLILSLVFTSAFGQEKWDLRRCVEYAISNNITVKQAEAQAASSRLTANQVRLTLLPTLGGSLSGSYQHGLNENPTTGTLESANFFSGSMGVQSGYTIFNWGVRKNNIAANELFANADALGIDKAKNDISLLVANAYLQIMLRREQVKISEVQLNQSRAQLAITRKLVDAGSQPELNALQIEAQVARDTSAFLEAQSLVEQGFITLKSYLNIDLASPFDIESPPVEHIPVESILDLQPEAVYRLALTTQPAQRMNAIRIDASKRLVASARGAMYPTLTAFAGLNTRFVNAKSPVIGAMPDKATSSYVMINGSQLPVFAPQFGITGYEGIPLFSQLNRNFGQSLGLSLNFPVFNAGAARTQWERAKINVVQYELQDAQQKLDLKANIYNAYQTAYASLQKYNASVKNVETSQRALEFSQKRFDIGLLGTLDFLITQSNLYRAKIEQVSNRYDFVFKLKVLEFYKGLGLKL